jgi:hypothetical protein
MAESRTDDELDGMGETEIKTPAHAKRPYEPPSCEKKRSIHRVTLISGMGVASMGVLSMSG